MEEFTYFEILLLNELVLREQKKIGKQLDSDVRRCVCKILRPGLFRRMQVLLDLECKLNRWGAEVREKENKKNNVNIVIYEGKPGTGMSIPYWLEMYEKVKQEEENND